MVISNRAKAAAAASPLPTRVMSGGTDAALPITAGVYAAAAFASDPASLPSASVLRRHRLDARHCWLFAGRCPE
ncbi:hypothetical protein [Streptomyces sp. NPDC006739]|uniref:hypothetical protein n=1 Tax=Streptomyces sp. NPDC006739 TaxID=3364763 RepID=UPI00367BD38D